MVFAGREHLLWEKSNTNFENVELGVCFGGFGTRNRSRLI